MDFSYPKQVLDIAHRVKEFVDVHVIPIERDIMQTGRELRLEEVQALRAKAKAEGLFAPTMPKHLGGMGLNILEFTPVLEAAGRSMIGPIAIHCSAPDEGNMHLLNHYANEEQVERYLRPLVAGEIFSAFSMTEPPPGAGSDPRMVMTRAHKEGEEWVINGHKWFSSNGEVAEFFLIMAVTDPDVHPYAGTSIFIAPREAEGIHIVRDVPTMGIKDFGGHVEIRYENLRLPESAILGKLGEGFAMSQARLAPARLTHCMRWTGVAQRALEIATQYASERNAFGKKLIEHEAIAFMLADSEMELYYGRLMMQHAAWKIVNGEEARSETSMAKVHISENVNKIIDRALQICGGTGVSRDLPISSWYESARAFRIYDGASEVHRMVAAREVVKKYATGSEKLKV